MAEVVGGPAFAFGDVVAKGRFQWEEPSPVGLCARFYALLMAPLEEGLSIALVEQFRLGELEIVSHPLHLPFEVGRLLCPILVADHIAQSSSFEHGEGQPRHQVVAATAAELLGKVGGPVCPFELHAIDEVSTQPVLHGTKPPLQRVRHVVKEMAHCFAVHVVEDGTRGPGGTVDDAGKGGAAH